MRRIQRNVILGIIFCVITVLFCTKVQAAGIGMSINKSSVYVGDTFSVTISGINGRVKISGNSNISINPSGTQWVRGNLTITGTAKSVGTGTITVTPEDVSTTGANPVEVTSSASKSIKISEKPVEKPKENQQQTTTNKNTTTQTTKKPTTTTTTKKTETKKTQIVETKEKEEATPELGIYSLKLIGIKENGEELEVGLDKEFNIKTFDYSCSIASDVKTVRIEKEAYEYNDIVQISGLEEELKVGENNITLKLAKDGKEVSYHIIITKEAKKEEPQQEEVSEVVAEPQARNGIIVSIPLIWFILLELIIVLVSVGITITVMLYLKHNPLKKENKGKSEEKEFKKI
ncbi:MAG: hypothetical protein J6A04_07135 [Clostridia bacterium]|nr:hypothetical protein [Clostridia bacterium]